MDVGSDYVCGCAGSAVAYADLLGGDEGHAAGVECVGGDERAVVGYGEEVVAVLDVVIDGLLRSSDSIRGGCVGV